MQSIYQTITNESILSSTNAGRYAKFEDWAKRRNRKYYKDGDAYIFQGIQRFEITKDDPLPKDMKIGFEGPHFIAIDGIDFFDGFFLHESWKTKSVYITNCVINDFTYFPDTFTNLLVNNCEIKSFKGFPTHMQSLTIGNNKKPVAPKDIPNISDNGIVCVRLLGNAEYDDFGTYSFDVVLGDNDIKYLDYVSSKEVPNVLNKFSDLILSIKLVYKAGDNTVKIRISNSKAAYYFHYYLKDSAIFKSNGGITGAKAIGADIVRKLTLPKMIEKLCKKVTKYKLLPK